ncbi:hypothetical protein SLEP1_g46649 [Rubroshorea leprosula]|uniref:Endoplasmic reticulum transmembrane protein n=1 Tax=Rubroshorea leprosula TaxID=152421 RepID=A0AAV5LNV1_9ROSI|nr:hypothetical protein SLEP1_g46649 [Rubroshorea leprosula]
MIQLLFMVVLTEMALVLILLFNTPIRELLMIGLDLMKRGKGPIVANTVAATILIVFIATMNSVRDIQKRTAETGVINPTDEVLMANLLLESSLMGFALFLALVTNRLHSHLEVICNTGKKAATEKDDGDHEAEKKQKEQKKQGSSKIG